MKIGIVGIAQNIVRYESANYTLRKFIFVELTSLFLESDEIKCV